jgi:hypothetical protein
VRAPTASRRCRERAVAGKNLRSATAGWRMRLMETARMGPGKMAAGHAILWNLDLGALFKISSAKSWLVQPIWRRLRTTSR